MCLARPLLCHRHVGSHAEDTRKDSYSTQSHVATRHGALLRQHQLNMSSEDLRRKSLLRDPIEYIDAAKYRWAGSVARRDDGRWTSATTDWYLRHVRRPRGRPPARRVNSIQETVEPGSHWSTVARDRLKWRMLGSAPVTG